MTHPQPDQGEQIDEVDWILLHGATWSHNVEPESSDWPRLVVRPDAKARLERLLQDREKAAELRGRITEQTWVEQHAEYWADLSPNMIEITARARKAELAQQEK